MDYSNNGYIDYPINNPFNISNNDYLLIIIPNTYSLYVNMTDYINSRMQGYIDDTNNFNKSAAINVNDKQYNCYIYKDNLVYNKTFINIIKKK